MSRYNVRIPNPHLHTLILNHCLRYLNDHSHFAVAQKQHVYIYDQQGIELHRLRDHIDITRLDYLPYHWLLVSIVRRSLYPFYYAD